MPVITRNEALNQFIQWIKVAKPDYLRFFGPGKKVGESIEQLAAAVGYSLDMGKKTAAICNELREHIIARDSH